MSKLNIVDLIEKNLLQTKIKGFARKTIYNRQRLYIVYLAS